jgi:hypothetical protein
MIKKKIQAVGTYDIITRAVPDVARSVLALAAAIGLARDFSAVAGGQDLSAVGTGLEGVALGVGRHGEGASGEEGEEGDGEELHFDRFLLFVLGGFDVEDVGSKVSRMLFLCCRCVDGLGVQ